MPSDSGSACPEGEAGYGRTTHGGAIREVFGAIRSSARERLCVPGIAGEAQEFDNAAPAGRRPAQRSNLQPARP